MTGEKSVTQNRPRRVLLVVGTGRSGTTIVAHVLAQHREFLYLEEPNFISDLYIPYANGAMDVESLRVALGMEGWRGPMKFCRMMAQMYPVQFADGGRCPVRKLMKREFARIVSESCDGSPTERRRSVVASVDRIMDVTCHATDRSAWLMKQPSAVLSCAELLWFWPYMKIIHVARRLEWVMLSRLQRGFQKSFDAAIKLCAQRLQGTAKLSSILPRLSVLHIRIEDMCANPLQSLDAIAEFVGFVPNKAMVRECMGISLGRLHALGDPLQYFTVDQLSKIEAVRRDMNRLFGRELV